MIDCIFIPRPFVHHTQCAQSCTYLIASLIPRPSHCPVFDRLPVRKNSGEGMVHFIKQREGRGPQLKDCVSCICPDQ